jgi:dihydrofolate reductase/thymidylate synthase
MFNIIVAVSKNFIIGSNNNIPWNCKEDMKYFRKITSSSNNNKDNVIVMGYNTWKSIGRKLPRRINIVIDRNAINPKVEDNVIFVNSLDVALNHIDESERGEIFVIGGGKIYREALVREDLDKVYLTKINKKFEGDITFPKLKDNFKLVEVKRGGDDDMKLEFRIYQRTDKKHEEYQYLERIEEIMRDGEVCSDRTGVGTKSMWGVQMSYDISESFPLLTTKRTFLRMIIEELLWFLRGSTNNKELKEKNVHIWDGNMSREFLDKIGLKDREEDDGGPIYGFNFRHFGAEYKDCHTDYTGQGCDQVAEVLRMIKEEPDSRRIIINLWNPNALKDMVLPPCHFVYHFRVYGDRLCCAMVQRSGDMGLGVPFNIASATLMTYIFAFLTGKKPWKLVHTIHDSHVYLNHEEQLEKQIKRVPYPFPKMKLVDRGQTCVEDFRLDDFDLMGYESHPTLRMKMAV